LTRLVCGAVTTDGAFLLAARRTFYADLPASGYPR
jgi:hypothetical protein